MPVGCIHERHAISIASIGLFLSNLKLSLVLVGQCSSTKVSFELILP